MSRVPDDLFEFLETARVAPSTKELDDAFARLIEGWGFNRWTAIPIAADTASPVQPFQVVFGRPSDRWSAHYRQNNYFLRDAAIRELLKSNDSIWWNVFARNSRLTPAERRLFHEAREHGIAEGLSAPVRLANNTVWVCALTGQEARPNWKVGDAARFAAERYLVRSLDLRDVGFDDEDESSLTRSQLNFVRHLAAGMSQKETAHVLGLSPRTVYNQVGAARKRVGARSVHELVRWATRAGLL